MTAPVPQSWKHEAGVGSARNLDKPTGTVEGDLIVIAICLDHPDNYVVSEPAGFTVLYDENFDNTTPSVVGWTWIGWKKAGASEPSTYNFTFNNSDQHSTIALRCDGQDGASPINVIGKLENFNTSIDCPSVVTTVPDTLILRFANSDNGYFTTDAGYPAGTTGIIWRNVTNNAGLGVAWENQAAAGASASRAWSITSSDQWAGITVAIAPVGGGGTTAVGLSTETNSAFPIGILKTASIGQSLETDSAQAVTQTATQTIPIGLPAETAGAFVIDWSKAILVGIAAEADTGLSLTWSKNASINQSQETDSAFAIDVVKQRLLGLPAEADSALPVTIQQTQNIPVALAAETDTAITFNWSKAVSLNQSLEQDSAFQVAVSGALAIGHAQETDTGIAVDIARQKEIGLSIENSTGLQVTGEKHHAIGLVMENDSGTTVTVGRLTNILPASETNIAWPLAWQPVISIGLAVEIDSAYALVTSLLVDTCALLTATIDADHLTAAVVADKLTAEICQHGNP